MRVATTKQLRVEPGDEVIVQARLAAAPIGRLYVFAREGDGDLSPYVMHSDIAGDTPAIQSPLSLRLTSGVPARVLRFTSEIDGHVCVMQEVDTPKDPLAKVRLQKRINPCLPWHQRLTRRVAEMFR